MPGCSTMPRCSVVALEEMLTADGNEIEIAGALMTVAEIDSLSETTPELEGPPTTPPAGIANRAGTGGW